MTARTTTAWGQHARRCLAALTLACVALAPAGAQSSLQNWPPEAAAQLNTLLQNKARQGEFAVFDADNTLYRNDLEESLLPYMEMKGLISRDSIDPSLKIIPFKDVGGHRESLNSYYYRLCEVDDMVCYLWVAQVFSGFTLAELKVQVDALMKLGQSIPATYYEGDVVKTVQINAPRPYRGQQQLVNALQAAGIEVYVISAASEELVRMVVSDPQYGYNIKPQNVIGVSLMLKNRQTGSITTARKLIAEKKYDPAALMGHELTPYPWAPLTWFEGKQAALHTYISDWKKAVLVAGDTPVSDQAMLFRGTDVEHGGLRVWVNRKDKYDTQIRAMRRDKAAVQQNLGLPVTADRGWIDVKADQIQ
jgi:hypothetical protein